MRRTFVLILLFSLCAVGVAAHPWGGLVVDGQGKIYFTFISPFVDEHHYASVWEINAQQELNEVLKSDHSPSDIVLARTPGRIIYAAERNNAGVVLQARLWRKDGAEWDLMVAPTTDDALFHIQAYVVRDDGTVFFAREDKLYKKTKGQGVIPLQTNGTFTRIDDLAWGPNGKLYMLDKGSLKVMSRDGVVSTLVADLRDEDPEGLPFSGANILFDLAVDHLGNVYVAYYGNRRVLKVTEEGQVSDFLLAERPWSPHGVDVYNRDVYVLESTVGSGVWWMFWKKGATVPRVRKVDALGNVTTVFEYSHEE